MTFAPVKSDIENDIPFLGDKDQRPADSPINTLETMLGLNLGLEMGEAALDALADAGDIVRGFFEGVAPEVIGDLEGGIMCTGIGAEPAPAMAPQLSPVTMPGVAGPNMKMF